MKIFITGGLGLIGSHLANQLTNAGIQCYIFDVKENHSDHFKINDNIIKMKGNILKDLKSFNSINDIDGIIHLAGVSRVIWGEKYPELCYDVNVNGTINILKLISKLKNKPWLIYGSSREVYGEQKIFPVSEDAPIQPINLYGKTKAESEHLCRKYATKFNFNLAILRFSNVYGSLNDHFDRVIPNFIIKALMGNDFIIQGGTQLFDFTHINDTVNGILKMIDILAEKNNKFINDYHILTGTPTTLQGIVSLIQKYHPTDSQMKYVLARNYDVNRFYGDPTKAHEELGFKSRISIEKGLKMAINTFKSNINVITNEKGQSNFISILKSSQEV